MKSYKETTPLEKRIEESNRQLTKHLDYIPIVLETNDRNIASLMKKRKLLVHKNLTVSEVLTAIRKQMNNLSHSEAIFLFCQGEIIMGSEIIGNLYDRIKEGQGITLKTRHKHDMFLYIFVSAENTFGTLIDLKLKFDEAVYKANHKKKDFSSKLSTSELLRLYGLYKRVISGLASSEAKPSFFNPVARQKWNAWEETSTMSKTKAMEEYISLVARLLARTEVEK